MCEDIYKAQRASQNFSKSNQVCGALDTLSSSLGSTGSKGESLQEML